MPGSKSKKRSHSSMQHDLMVDPTHHGAAAAAAGLGGYGFPPPGAGGPGGGGGIGGLPGGAGAGAGAPPPGTMDFLSSLRGLPSIPPNYLSALQAQAMQYTGAPGPMPPGANSMGMSAGASSREQEQESESSGSEEDNEDGSRHSAHNMTSNATNGGTSAYHLNHRIPGMPPTTADPYQRHGMPPSTSHHDRTPKMMSEWEREAAKLRSMTAEMNGGAAPAPSSSMPSSLPPSMLGGLPPSYGSSSASTSSRDRERDSRERAAAAAAASSSRDRAAASRNSPSLPPRSSSTASAPAPASSSAGSNLWERKCSILEEELEFRKKQQNDLQAEIDNAARSRQMEENFIKSQHAEIQSLALKAGSSKGGGPPGPSAVTSAASAEETKAMKQQVDKELGIRRQHESTIHQQRIVIQKLTEELNKSAAARKAAMEAHAKAAAAAAAGGDGGEGGDGEGSEATPAPTSSSTNKDTDRSPSEEIDDIRDQLIKSRRKQVELVRSAENWKQKAFTLQQKLEQLEQAQMSQRAPGGKKKKRS